MRQSVASNTVRAQRFDEPAKRKAVPDDTGPGLASWVTFIIIRNTPCHIIVSTSKQKKQKKDDLTGFDPEWEAVIKKRALLKKTKVATMAADTDAPDADEDSMVHYGGFVGDNEDDTGEAAAAREQVVKFKKPVKGLYASISFILVPPFSHSSNDSHSNLSASRINPWRYPKQ